MADELVLFATNCPNGHSVTLTLPLASVLARDPATTFVCPICGTGWAAGAAVIGNLKRGWERMTPAEQKRGLVLKTRRRASKPSDVKGRD